MVQTNYERLCDLTTEENKVLGEIANGLDNQRIAEKLSISLQSVDRYCTQIYSKYDSVVDFTGRSKRVTLAIIYWGLLEE